MCFFMVFSLFNSSNHPLHPRIMNEGTMGRIYLENAIEKEEIKTKKKSIHDKRSKTTFSPKILFLLRNSILIRIPIKAKMKRGMPRPYFKLEI